MPTPWICFPDRRDVPASLLGGKGAALCRLSVVDGRVPPFFVVTTAAFHESAEASCLRGRVAEELKARAGGDDASWKAGLAEIRALVAAMPLPDALTNALREACNRSFRPDEFLAVRSSAADEDAAGQSFAGMHDSFVFVRGFDNVRAAVKKVWASAYNDRAVAYRKNQGLPLSGIAVAVVVQRMIDAAKSGVLFTCHPATGSPHQVVVSALFGAGEGLVGAGLEADTYTVDKQSLAITAELAPKREQLVLDAENGGGLKHVALRENLRTASTLTDDEVRQVARLGLAAEKFFRRPQDVEFCFDAAGTLFLLQSRPVTNVAEYGPAAGNRLVWDNSNIIESYSGVTSPMTFSFIRQAYTIVYHCFCDVMGIPPRVVRESRPVFENMLGLFRGRVYYNLQNWYRLIRLFPGFAYNAKFMETMMGLKEPLVLDDPLPPVGFWRKWFVELPALVKLIARSVWNFARIRGTVDRFQNHFRRHYEKWDRLNMDALPPHELAALYREMEKALLWNWKAPIINDFYVMIYFGVLKKLCASWCGDTTGALQNDLICGEGGVESAEPARMLLRLAQMAQGEPALRDRILHDRLEDLPATIAADPRSAAFQAQFEKYLDLYGFRCMNELKLEEYSLRDRPHHVYQVLRNYLALNDPAALDVAAMKVREQNVRRGAEERAFSGLAKRRTWYPRGLIFRRVLRNARLGVKNRENMRFARTRIYGLLRQLLRAMGRQFAAEGILADAEDIFYLTLDEVFDYIKGTAVTTHLRELAALRRAEFDEYRRDDLPAPDERFETFGPAYHKNLFRDPRPAPKNTDGKLRGIGCSPGVVEGVVKVLKSPAEAQLSREILVAERTDPGWVPLYPAVSGILIERGSLLSHSAVVAREMGIPTIVGITGLLATVQSGQRVRMDGQAGTVDVL